MVLFYFGKGLAPSTKRTYKAAQDRYLKFCRDGRFRPIPVSQSVLCAFVSWLASKDKLKHSSLKVYLSGVRHLQIVNGLPDPFAGVAFPQLDQVMKGIKRHEAEKGVGKKQRLPISPTILNKLWGVWSEHGENYNTRMIWAACCLCFFAFLRAGEMTVPSDTEYDETVHLGIKDVAVDDANHPSILQIRIKQSKTDPFRQGINLYVGKTGSHICPVASMMNYLQARGMGTSGPLFRFSDGRVLTRKRFVDAVRDGLKKAGVDERSYSGHSFRIGAATTAAKKGIEDAIIKTLGRWESLAYLEYIKVPRSQLAGISSRLID